ncbi:class I SAM-dependent methyltransferase [Paraburkholderia bannensis]|uniref:class I SAM-dependent methyltransferase n=1 Tax=Paraburkholderia bannensis TaxID=765414 RepID=UPI002AB6D193|nr:class I SAM-dependent methyltransferase [Paraburkholderia bannensis]
MNHHPLEFTTPESLWVPDQIITSAWLEHAPFAFWIIQAVKPRVFVELGSHFGFSYLAFCQAVLALNLPTRCFAVDTWVGDDHAGFYGNEVFDQLNINNEKSYSSFSRLMRMRFDEALPCFSDGEIDLLHIDGRHGYEDVLEDFSTWLPKMSDRGIVLLHDINVRKHEFGVWKLWQELIPKFPNFEFFHGHGLGVLGVGTDLSPNIKALFTCDSTTASKVRRTYSQLGQHVTQRAVLKETYAQMVVNASDASQLRDQVSVLEAQARETAKRQAMLDARATDVARQNITQSKKTADLELQLARSNEQAQQTNVALAEQVARATQLEQDLAASHESQKAATAFEEELKHLHSIVVRSDTERERLREELTHARQQLAASQRQIVETHNREVSTRDHATRLEVHCADLEIRNASYESSTIWRATGPLRKAFTSISPGGRLMLRRIAKGVFWLATPHRTAARLRFLEQRRRSAAVQTVIPSVSVTPSTNSAYPTPEMTVELTSWFDSEWYEQEYPDVAAAGMDPYTHFTQHGWRERRNPHPLFDVSWYLSHHPQLEERQTAPITHFIDNLNERPAHQLRQSKRNWNLSEQTYGDVPSSLPIPYVPALRAPDNSLSAEVFHAQLDTIEIVSFDIFDTALYRRTMHPTTIFDLLGERFDKTLANLPYQYADIRFWAEHEARKRALEQKGSLEIDLQAIYEVVVEFLGMGRNEAQSFMLAEMDEERKALAANPTILAMANAALARGKRVIFVSDMYLPSDFLGEILLREGFPKADVFVSCEHLAGKWENKLFEIVATRCGVDGSKILHVGDNFNSDKIHAERAGWRAMHYRDTVAARPYALQLIDTSKLRIDNVATSVTVGLAHLHRARVEASQLDSRSRMARHIGYEVLGPTVLGFAAWIAQHAREAKLDRVLFLARDGYLPSIAYERLRARDSSLCSSRYVAASRRLLYCMSFETEDDVLKVARHIGFTKDTTLDEYLDVFQLTYEDVKIQADLLGFGDAHQPIAANTDFTREYGVVHQRLLTLVRHFAPLTLSRTREREDILRTYYEQNADVADATRVAMVDLGWAGSMMQPLRIMLEKINPMVDCRALFFGLNSRANTAIPESIKSHAYFFNREDAQRADSPFVLPSQERPQDILGASLSLMEVLISANHPTYIDVRHDESTDKILPVTAGESYSPEQREFLQAAHDACRQFVDDALDMLPRATHDWDFRPLIGLAWTRLLSSPDAEEAAVLGAFPHRVDASGHAATTSLIELPAPSADRAALWDAFTHAMWPNGWFALLDPAQRGRMLSPITLATND